MIHGIAAHLGDLAHEIVGGVLRQCWKSLRATVADTSCRVKRVRADLRRICRLVTVKAAIQFLMIVATSVILGPLIGGFVFFVVLAAMDLAASNLDDVKGLFVISMLGTYAVGGPIALVAGILVAVFNCWRLPRLRVILVSIVIANIAVLVAQPIIGFGWGGFFINLAASIFAGSILWFVFRRRLSAR